jgi:hypothetical protein
MRDQGEEDAAILQQATVGKTAREIARLRGLTMMEVNRSLDRSAAAMFSAEGTRRAMAAEVQRLEALKSMLFHRTMDQGDMVAGALYVKVSERMATMLGWNHPIGHVVSVTSNLEPEEHESSTMTLLRAIRRLRGEAEPPEEEEPEAGEKLN